MRTMNRQISEKRTAEKMETSLLWWKKVLAFVSLMWVVLQKFYMLFLIFLFLVPLMNQSFSSILLTILS